MTTKNERVLITGGSGMIGQHLTRLLLQAGYAVSILSRSQRQSDDATYFQWSIKEQKIDTEAIATADHIVHLAGAGIADKRWTDQRKKVLRSSRLDGLDLIYKTLQTTEHKVKSLISASAIGYYGDAGDALLTEEAPAGSDFAAKLCVDWEAKAKEASTYGLRSAQIRVGLVMSNDGGALPKLLTTYPLALSYFGTGSHYQSWIHIDDLARIFLHAIETPSMEGPYNAVGPEPLTQKDLMKTIKEAGNPSPLVLPAPAFGIRLAFGEMADILLASQNCAVTKLKDAGFTFHFPTAKACMSDLLSKHKQ